MSRSPECAAIEKCSDVAVKLLSSGVVSLDTFGQELVSADFITNEALQSILDTLGVSATTKARKLLSIVHTQVKVNNEKFFKRFVNILENTPPLATLHDRILTGEFLSFKAFIFILIIYHSHGAASIRKPHKM